MRLGKVDFQEQERGAVEVLAGLAPCTVDWRRGGKALVSVGKVKLKVRAELTAGYCVFR